MTSEYSDSSYLPCLCVDAGSPITSVAVATEAGSFLDRSTSERRSSGQLLALIDEVLTAASLRAADLRSLAGLRGPGSFTGLRVTSATLIGLQEALGIRATAIGTLEVLGFLKPAACERAIAVVDALRNEWFWQAFPHCDGRTNALAGEPPFRSTLGNLPIEPGTVVIGHGVECLEATYPEGLCTFLEAGPLAPVALQMLGASPPTWDAGLLSRPLYLRAAPPPKGH